MKFALVAALLFFSALPAGASGADLEWQAVARLPNETVTRAVAETGGKVYFFGGQQDDRKLSYDTWQYDDRLRIWTIRRPMPEARYVRDAAVLDGLIYLIGGCPNFDCTSPTAEGWVYDPIANTYTNLPAMPEAIYDATTVGLGGRVYVIGGIVGDRASARVYAYDPSSRAWTKLKDMPGPRSHTASVDWKGRIFVLGGCSATGKAGPCMTVAADVFSYDPATDTWAEETALPVPLYGLGAFVDGDRLLVAAGGRAPTMPADPWTYTLKYGGRSVWERGPMMRKGRRGARLFRLARGGIGVFGPGPEGHALAMIEGLATPAPYVEWNEPRQPTNRFVVVMPGTSAPEVPDVSTGAPRPHSHAIVIGVESYRETLPRADFAGSDARTVARFFERRLGVPKENIVTLIDNRATKGDFEKYFERWLPNRVEKNDEVFVYYSGHGAPNPATGDSYLVPFDADPAYIDETGYATKRLFRALGKLPAKRVVVALDSCFSGAGGHSVIAKGTRPLVTLKSDAITGKVIVITASTGGQISNSYQEKQHGLFTWFFLQGMRERGDDFRAIYDDLKPQVERIARRQFNSSQTPDWRTAE